MIKKLLNDSLVKRIDVRECDQIEGHVLICVAAHKWILSRGLRTATRRVPC